MRLRSPRTLAHVAARAAVLLCALLCSGPLAAQQPFVNDDFDFQMTLPAGLAPVDASGLMALFGVTREQAANPPRSQSGAAPLQHVYAWIDASTPYNRQVSLRLADEPPPFRSLDEFASVLSQQSGLTIESSEQLAAPVLGAQVIGTFPRPGDGILMRRLVLLLPDAQGGRHGLLSVQAYASDWPRVSADVAALVQSVRLARSVPSAPATAARPHGAGSTLQPAPARWGDLRVAGSLALAALLAGHLLLARRTRLA